MRILSSWLRYSSFRNVRCQIDIKRQNSNRTCLVKIGRKYYCRMYPTRIVNHDGSTYTIRHHEPIKIVNLPLDISKLTAEELDAHFKKLRPKPKLVLEDDIDDDFNINQYSHLWKKT